MLDFAVRRLSALGGLKLVLMSPTLRQILLIIKRIGIVIGIALAFSLGLAGAIILSLRSSQTQVPDVVGKDRASAETTIEDAGLNFRVRATRATSEAKPDTVLIQLPAAGVTVKVGQTVAVDISRATTNGESSTPANTNENGSVENRNQNTNTSITSASPGPTPKKKAANRNANDNANANATANRNQNRNTNLNANRVTTNANGNANSTTAPSNANTGSANTNRPPRNVNANRRPTAAPTP